MSPAYQASPFQQRSALLPGVPSYSWGSQNDRTPPSRFSIQSVAISGDVATLAVKLLEGLIPIVGALISVLGTESVAGLFNVTNVALASVSINSTTGVGTLTFALTGTNLSTTADSGSALVPQPIVGEALVTGPTAGQQFAIQSQSGGNKQHGLSWFTQFTGSPSTVAMELQVADFDRDADYTTVDESTNTAGETRSVGNITANFVRIRQTSTGGTSPTVAAGIILS